MGILYRMRKENPEKEFILAGEALICPSMKLISLENLHASLRTLTPVITVPEEIRNRSRVSLDRMLAVPRD